MLDAAIMLLLIVVGVFSAVATRTMLPYIKKVNEAIDAEKEPPKFNKYYILTGAFSGIVTVFLLGVGLITIITSIDPNIVSNAVAGFICTSSGFTSGWTANDILNSAT